MCTEMNDVKDQIKQEFVEKDYENVNSWSSAKIKSENAKARSNFFYRDYINKLDLEFKMKEMLQTLKDVTIKIKGVVVKIGKILLNSIIKLIEYFPNTVMGLVIGLFLSLIVKEIPVLGKLVTPVFMPLVISFTCFTGLVKDLQQSLIHSKFAGSGNN